jgi:lysozyme
MNYRFLFILLGLVTGICIILYYYPPKILKNYLQTRNIKVLLKKGQAYYYGMPGEPVAWPAGHSVRGVDVSRYQTHVDWPVVKMDNIAFAFIKASEGFYRHDKLFAAHWQESGAAGIRRGAYHFYRPGQPATLQALNFIWAVDLASGDLPPVLDVEQIGHVKPEVLREGVATWLDLVQKTYKVKPIIYSNYNFYLRYLAGYFDGYPLWIAHYRVPHLQIKPGPKHNLKFWQLTDRGTVGGMAGRVDCNVFFGSQQDLLDLCVP